MIDWDDVDFAILATPVGGIGAVIGVVIVVALAVCAYRNTSECEAKACPPGMTARLMDHECLCVTKAEGQ